MTSETKPTFKIIGTNKFEAVVPVEWKNNLDQMIKRVSGWPDRCFIRAIQAHQLARRLGLVT